MQVNRALPRLALAIAILVGAAAAAGPADAQWAHFCGMVRQVGRGACLIVPGSMSGLGRHFDVSSARPLPRRNTTIAGSGLVRGLSHCSRADRRLDNVTWRRVSVCPLGRA
jgi:hypothetical protein